MKRHPKFRKRLQILENLKTKRRISAYQRFDALSVRSLEVFYASYLSIDKLASCNDSDALYLLHLQW